jgi:hypothetical protein
MVITRIARPPTRDFVYARISTLGCLHIDMSPVALLDEARKLRRKIFDDLVADVRGMAWHVKLGCFWSYHA